MENMDNNENPIKDFEKNEEPQVITEEKTNNQEPVKAEVTNNTNQEQAPKTKTMNSFALVSFICSLVGLAVCGLPLGIAATITGAKALKDFKPEIENNKWMAIFGLILGIIDIVCVVIFLFTISKTGYGTWWR